MSYELLKRLRDAGFPQRGNGIFHPKPAIDGGDYSDTSYEPLLDELIDACGDKFVSLNRVIDPVGWSCDFENSEGFIEDTAVESNPKEAVAELWLVLHKKS